MYFTAAQFANLDMLVAGCITATILALAHGALCFEQDLSYRRILWLAYGLAGLGLLAKGLIGFVIPAMVIGLWLLLRWRWRTLWALVSVPGLIPVSYTHLDVYKRQDMGSAAVFVLMINVVLVWAVLLAPRVLHG